MTKPPLNDGRYRAQTFSQRLSTSIQTQKKGLRSSNTRNPKEPLGKRSPSKAQDEEFYNSLRQQVARTPKSPRPEYAELRSLADSASVTKSVLQEWKDKIASLEENLKNQDGAMEDVMSQNEYLETKVNTLTRKEKVDDQLSLGLPGVPSMHHLVEENKELGKEVKKLKLDLLTHAVDDAAGKEAIAERNSLLKKKKELEKALSMAREENDKLLEEVSSANNSKSEAEALLEHNRIHRKEAQLEKSLAAAKSENEALIEEVRRHNLEFEKTERLREKEAEEIRTLRTELEMNRRIVHTKRSLIQKEMTEESKQEMRNDVEERLTIELTAKITDEVETRMRAEKENYLREMRKGDEEKVRAVDCQIPILENEIDRLREDLSNATNDHERNVASIKQQHQNKLERIVENFSDDRKREGTDFSKRIETISVEMEQSKKRAAIEKEEYGSKIREEVTAEMQKEIRFLAEKVTELTKESIEVVEKMKKEKESFGESIRDLLTKEKNELMDEAVKEKVTYAQRIREEITADRDQEISKIKSELEKITTERNSLLASVEKGNEEEKQSDELRKELEDSVNQLRDLENEKDSLQGRLEEMEADLRLTKENYGKDVEELYASRIQLESTKTEMIKLKNQRDELIIMADEFKNDCIHMSNEMKKIKGHFKFAVLVEYEQKIIELEDELLRLGIILQESKAFNSEDANKISEQFLQLKQHKSKEQALENEVKRLTEAVLSSVSELESKEARLTELKDIMQKKETEVAKLNECAKDLRRNLSASENEVTRLQNEQELSNQRILSTQVYKDKIASLNKELTKQKSELEQNSALQEDSRHLQQRMQKMSGMLRVAEKNQQKEQLSFEATKEKQEKNLLACKSEIKRLHSEVSRLKNLLDLSRKSLNREGRESQCTQNGETPRMGNSHQQNVERSKQKELLKIQQKELLQNIQAAERATHDLKRHRSESENAIRTLKNQLRLRDEERIKAEKELYDSKLLFKEAVMSWRVESRNLRKQLDQSRYSGRTEPVYDDVIQQNYLDGESDPSETCSKPQHRLSRISNENNNSEQRENLHRQENNSRSHTFGIAEIETGGWSKRDKYQPAPSNLKCIQNSEIRDDVEVRVDRPIIDPFKDAESEIRDNSNKGFTKMLDISEHTTSIEMRFDQLNHDFSSVGDQSEDEQFEGEKRETDNAEAIYNRLQEFKREYKQYATSNDFAGSVGNSLAERKAPFVQGSNSKIPRLSPAPQPQMEDSSNDDEDRNIIDDSVSMSRRNNMTSGLDTRAAPEIVDSSSNDASEKTSASERSRILRKKMTDLLEIKNNITLRSSAHFTADTNPSKRRVVKQQQLQEETSTTTSNSPLRTPWGLTSGKHPKLSKFLSMKTPPEMNRRGRPSLSMVPTDERLERRKLSLPLAVGGSTTMHQ